MLAKLIRPFGSKLSDLMVLFERIIEKIVLVKFVFST
jgi:hypothetical protein